MYEVPPPQIIGRRAEHGKLVNPPYDVIVIVAVTSRHVVGFGVGHAEIVTMEGCCDDIVYPCVQELG